MKRITVVLEYRSEADMPSFNAGMRALGGAVVGVLREDATERLPPQPFPETWTDFLEEPVKGKLRRVA